MDKDNNFYNDDIVYFGTKHGKEEAIGPLLPSAGLRCFVALIDTDQFGTFSGEKERTVSVKETLKNKTNAVFARFPEANLALASEGSFGPHPQMPFMDINHEALLFVDRKNDFEIYVDDIFFQTNLARHEFKKGDDLNPFLQKIGFPPHAVMMKTKSENFFKYKGIQSYAELEVYLQKLYAQEETLIIATDMRGHANPTRLSNISSLGQKLVNAMKSRCPMCTTPGFVKNQAIAGLECETCGQETKVPKEFVHRCVKCHFTGHFPNTELVHAHPAECDFCNP